MKIFYKRLAILLLIITIILTSLLVIKIDCLVIEEVDSREVIWQQPTGGKIKFAIKYLHSVARTPVWEYFQVKDEKLLLVGTKYHSYGAGLPFLQQHKYIVADDKFEIQEINQELDKIQLRVSNYAKHRFIVNSQQYKLYQLTKPMELVIIKVEDRRLLDLLMMKLISCW